MVTANKFKVDPSHLQDQQVSVLKALYREGDRHMKYYHSTMGAFKFPEKRMKCFDTKYFEEVMPMIEDILKQHAQLKVKV